MYYENGFFWIRILTTNMSLNVQMVVLKARR